MLPPCCCMEHLKSVQFSSVTQSCPTLCNPIDWSTLGFLSITNSWSLLKLMSIELVMPSNHLILCRHLLLSSIFPSIRVFSKELVLCIRWPSIGVSASASVFPMNIQGWFPWGFVWSPCSRRDSQESSPTPQFKSISSPALSLLYGPTITSTHNY